MTLKDLSPGEIVALVIGLILAAATFVNQVGAAVERINKAKRAAEAPTNELDTRVSNLEKWRTEVDGKLGRDYAELKKIHLGNHAIFQALLALLDHGIDGNNISQMQDAKKELQDHLISQ